VTKPLIFDDAAARELELSAIWCDHERAGLGDESFADLLDIGVGVSRSARD